MTIILFIIIIYSFFQFFELKIRKPRYARALTIRWCFLKKTHQMIIFSSPLKGSYAYEVQILNLVLQVPHGNNKNLECFKKHQKVWKIYYWFDSCWIKSSK